MGNDDSGHGPRAKRRAGSPGSDAGRGVSADEGALPDVRGGGPAGDGGDRDELDAPPGEGDTLERGLADLLGGVEGAAPIALEGRVLAGKYRLLSLIGEGGMGQVYRATHVETGGALAVKLLRPGASNRAQARKRFQNEARNAAALLHPNSVRTTDFGQDAGLLYLVMEYVDGEPLSALLEREAPLPWRRAASILAQVLEALWAAHEHERRIVHRDIKPENILLCETAGARDFVKVADFGISRALEATGADTAGAIGSPWTMAPEQWRGDPIDARTDLYAVGCTAYQMLSGRRVFQDVTGVALAYQHLHELPVPLADLAASDTPAALIGWVERMMAKEPGDRFESAAEALAALEAASEPEAPASRERPRWTRALLRTGVLLAVVTTGVVAATAWRTAGDEPVAAAPAARAGTSPSDEPGARDRPDAFAAGPRPAKVDPYHRCGPEAALAGGCSDGFLAWCDARERQVACCMLGMVPVDATGICDCAPGGTDHEAALRNGCPRAAPPDERRRAIRTVFRSAVGHYQRCYESALAAAPDRPPQGKVVVGLEIGPNGGVYSARVKEGSLPSPSVQRCILAKIEELRFQPPVDGWVTISYPLILRSRETSHETSSGK